PPTSIYTLSLHDALPISGTMPLLSVYALRLGASAEAVSAMIAAAYVALAIGTAVAHRLAALAQSSKRALVAAGLLSAPMLGLLRSEEHTSELQSRFDLVC